MNPSGVRYGTAAITTRGIKQTEIKKIVAWINTAIEHKDESNVFKKIKKKVKEMCLNFPIPSV
jgi:glycine hydroxymethyltransferase